MVVVAAVRSTNWKKSYNGIFNTNSLDAFATFYSSFVFLCLPLSPSLWAACKQLPLSHQAWQSHQVWFHHILHTHLIPDIQSRVGNFAYLLTFQGKIMACFPQKSNWAGEWPTEEPHVSWEDSTQFHTAFDLQVGWIHGLHIGSILGLQVG